MPNWQHTIFLTSESLFFLHIYASLSINELTARSSISNHWKSWFSSTLNIQQSSLYLNQCWPRSSYIITSVLKFYLTHWGRVMHICVSKLNSIVSDNGLSPGRRQAITWTNDGILLIGPLGTNFSETFSKIPTFSFKKMHLKTSSAKWLPFFVSASMS